MSTLSAAPRAAWYQPINSPALRRIIIILLALFVLLSLITPYITYPVPAYEGYDSKTAVVDAQAKYEADLQTYYDNVILRDKTQQQIANELQPAYDTVSATLTELQAAETPDEAALAAAQTAVDEAKVALSDARKVLAGLQNLIAPVPVQDPVPASPKEDVTAVYSLTGLDLIAGKLAAAVSLGVAWTLLPGMALIAVGLLLTLLKTPLKLRKPVLLLGAVLLCFSALRIETAGNKELGAIAKVYSFGWGYNVAIILSVLLLLSILFENKEFHISLKKISTFASDKAIYLVLLALVCAIAVINPRFVATDTFINIIQQSSTRLIIAMGMSFVIIGTGGVDLSASRMVGMAAVISASMLQTSDYSRLFYPNLPQLSVILPFLLAVVIALLFGLLNGFIVAKLNVPPFITTLATMVIVYGATSIYFNMPPNNSQPIGGLRDDFTYLGTGKIYGFIPIIVIIALIVCIGVWFLQNKTVFGKNVFAIGGNRDAAKVSGINVTFTVIAIFALASALIGMAGVLEAARTGGATNNYGVGYELDAIAACVVGGVSSSGGVGTVGGVISGVFIFQVINYGLTFIGVDPYWQQIIKGIIIASAVALDIRKYMNKK
jgi:methyl-galactoside transport system permease protein